MNPGLKIDITVGTLRAMNPHQFEALKENILAEGRWENCESIRLVGSDPLGVDLPGLFIGIEKDGYTHS